MPLFRNKNGRFTSKNHVYKKFDVIQMQRRFVASFPDRVLLRNRPTFNYKEKSRLFRFFLFQNRVNQTRSHVLEDESICLYLLKDFGGSLIFECNYTMKDLSIISIFYRELLQWWSEFRDHFSDEKYWLSIIWNHKDIRINGKPVFYKTYYNSNPDPALKLYLIAHT